MRKNAFITTLVSLIVLAPVAMLLQAKAETEQPESRAFAPSGLIPVTDKTFDKEVSRYEKPVFLFACSSKMAPCHKMGPTVNEVAKKYANEMKFVIMDPIDSESLTKRYGLRAYPSCILMLPSSHYQYAHNIIVGPASAQFLEQAIGRTIETFKSPTTRGLEGNQYEDIVIFREQK